MHLWAGLFVAPEHRHAALQSGQAAHDGLYATPEGGMIAALHTPQLGDAIDAVGADAGANLWTLLRGIGEALAPPRPARSASQRPRRA